MARLARANRRVTRPALALAGLGLVAIFATAVPAAASRFLTVGISGDIATFRGDSPAPFALLQNLHARELRLTLYWGGPRGVAPTRPANPADPSDPAYRWAPYDQAVRGAAKHGIRVLFDIYGTPGWANGGGPPNRAPTQGIDLRNFAYAAAVRYSGTFSSGVGIPKLPAVREWEAWNEPNNPAFLTPQYKWVAGSWVVQSAVSYATICNAVYSGVHATLLPHERVACGATAPTGNDDPDSARPSVSPLVFLTAANQAGLVAFDAWSHHAGPPSAADSPGAVPATVAGDPVPVTLANVGKLIALVNVLYGDKPIWITEYGYPTDPPNKVSGVSWATQAAYLTQAFTIARQNPSIDMVLWSGLVDKPGPTGTQSGLVASDGVKKPAFGAFRAAAR